MSALRRTIVLCCCAAAGVALAIGVATGSRQQEAPTSREAPKAGLSEGFRSAGHDREDDSHLGAFAGRREPAHRMEMRQPRYATPDALGAAELSGKSAVNDASSARPAPAAAPEPGAESLPVAETAVPLRLVGPDLPVRTPPLPRHGQMLVPEPARQHLEQVYQYLRQELQPPGTTAEPAPMPPGKGLAGEAGETAAAATERSAPPPTTSGQTGGPTLSSGADSARNAPGGSSTAAGEPEAATLAQRGDGKLIIHFPDNDIREVLEMLAEQGNLNILASKSVQGRVSASLSGVDLQSALDAILKSAGYVARREGNFIFVGTPEDFEALENANDRIGTRVYRPNYVSAAELQKLIQPLLTEKVGVVSVSTPSEVGIQSDDTQAGGDNYAGSDVVVVRDYEGVLAQIDQMVREIDVRPMMVHIEAMILSVKLHDEDRYGVDFELLRNVDTIKFGLGNPPASLDNFNFAAGTLKFGFLDSSLGAFLNALETLGDVNVIATPRLMVLNKHRAEIQIGESKGYVSTTITETSSSQSVEFLDVGTLLRLRPFISSDGLVRMEIHPELSDGTVRTENGFTLPEKEVTQVTTNIMVRDGCTVVIGGLMRENLSTTRNQIPFFGNLPIVGVAFRNSTETTERREVIVLITPRIVYEPGTCAEGEKVACEFHRREAHYFDTMTPINERRRGERYFRLAQSAWAGGQREKALRFAELAVHYDPLNRAALELRSAIWQGRPLGDHTLQAELVAPQPSAMLDGAELPPWLLGELSETAPGAGPASQTLHPRDPGQPGRHTDLVRPHESEQP